MATIEEFDPFSIDYLRDPAPALKRAQRENPIFFYPRLNCWIVTRYDDLSSALLDVKTFSSRATGMIRPPPDIQPLVPDLSVEELIITIDPPVHAVHRGTMTRGFMSSVVSRIEGVIRQSAIDLIDGFIDRGEVDLMEHFCVPLTMNTIVEILGIPAENRRQYRQWSEDFFFLFTPRLLDNAEPVEIRTVDEAEVRTRWSRLAEANQFLRAHVDARNLDPGDDVISEMLQVTDSSGEKAISPGAVVRHLISLIGAGHDTTANSIAHLVYYLSANPDQKQRLQDDPALIPNAVEEGLRIRGTSPGLFRVTTADFSARGVTIPAGSLVYLMVSAGGHDEEVFPDSMRFDVSRENASKHLAFGFGRHFCIGAALARMQARIALEELYRRMPDLEVVPGFERQYIPMMTIVGLRGLQVRWSPAAPRGMAA